MKNNRIAYWTSNSHIVECLISINKKLKLELSNINCAEDLISLPGFVIMIDSLLLTEQFLNDLNPFLKHWDKNEHLILAVGKRFIINDPEIRKLVKFIPNNIDKETLEGIIKYRMKIKLKKNKDDIFKSKLYRIIFIYDALRRGVTVRTEDLCEIFDVSDRTIRRDFKILKEVLDEKIWFDKDGGFFIS